MDADWWYSYFSCVYFKVYLPLTVCTGYYVHIQWTHIWSPLQPTAMWCTPSAPSTALQAAGGERTDPSHMLEHRKPHLTERVAHTPGWDPGLSSGAKLDTSFGIWTDLTELLDSSLALNPSGGLPGQRNLVNNVTDNHEYIAVWLVWGMQNSQMRMRGRDLRIFRYLKCYSPQRIHHIEQLLEISQVKRAKSSPILFLFSFSIVRYG